jgi:ATP-binding cassette subfamily B protein
VHDRINKRSEEVQEKLSDISTFVQETFSGIRVIKAYAREMQFQKNYDKPANDYLKTSMDLVRVNALFMPSMYSFFLIFFIPAWTKRLFYFSKSVTILTLNLSQT